MSPAAFSPKYPLSLRILHWLIAALILALLAVGLVMTHLDKDDPSRPTLFGLHKSFGVTLLLLAALRLYLRLRLIIPPLPEIIPAFERAMAGLSHWLLYGFMFAMPLSGYLMTNFFGRPVQWFGLTLPKLVAVDKDRGEWAWQFHWIAAYLLIGLITLHASAALWHFLRQRVNLLERMW